MKFWSAFNLNIPITYLITNKKLEKFDGEVSTFKAADQIANKYFS